MKISEKVMLSIATINMIASLFVTSLPVTAQIFLMISMIGLIGFFYLNGMDYCKKLEKAANKKW